MTRVTSDGHVAVDFVEYNVWRSGTRIVSMSLEHFLLLVDEAKSLAQLRRMVFDEAPMQEPYLRQTKMRNRQAKAAAAASSE